MLKLKFLFKDGCSWQTNEFLRETRSHPRTLENIFHTKKITRIEQEEWYEKEYCVDKNYLIWLVYDESKDAPVAYIQNRIESLIHKRCSFGYVIAPEHNIIKDIYSDAVIKMAVNNIIGMRDEIHRIETKILTTDLSRLEHLTNNGFEIDGVIRDYVYKDFQYKDVYVLSHLINS